MKTRCKGQHPEHRLYYQERGIRVYPAWARDFLAFLKHVGPRPSPQHSIDRINNNKGYEPGNVRWATAQEQTHNSRRHWNRITHEGITKTLTEWAADTGLSVLTIYNRLQHGWSSTEALTRPPMKVGDKRCSYLTYQGRTQTRRAWAAEVSLPYTTLTKRLNDGWDLPRALITPPKPDRRRH